MGYITVVCFDTNILIYFIENDIDFGLKATLVLAKTIDEDAVLFSCLALTELHSHPQTREQLNKLEQLKTVTTFVPIDESIATEAGKLRRKFPSLKTPDALHIATALFYKADVFITNDQKLWKLKIPQLKITGLA